MRLRILIARRAEHPDWLVSPQLDGWLTGAIGLRKGASQEVDEFSRADKRFERHGRTFGRSSIGCSMAASYSQPAEIPESVDGWSPRTCCGRSRTRSSPPVESTPICLQWMSGLRHCWTFYRRMRRETTGAAHCCACWRGCCIRAPWIARLPSPADGRDRSYLRGSSAG